MRISAFGYFAGFAGAAVALLTWNNHFTCPGEPLHSVFPPDYPSQVDLEKAVKDAVSHTTELHGSGPKIIVIGALGRCGHGAIDCCLAAGVPKASILKSNMAETAKGGPFPEIAASDIFINCIYLREPMSPFVTIDSLSKPSRKLRVVIDVSCDPDDPNNPVPLYHECTTFYEPTIPVEAGDGSELSVIAIDHLPSLVAREASEHFFNLLLPSLRMLHRRKEEVVWVRAEELFREKDKELPEATS